MPDGSVSFNPNQVELLTALVEASKSVRHEFRVLRSFGGYWIRHPALPDGQMMFYEPDLLSLEELGLFTVTHLDSRGKTSAFDISPQGLAVYSELHLNALGPQQSVEEDMQRFIESDSFLQRYPQASERWQSAAAELWAGDMRGQLTEVGHYCREALQAFADVLCESNPVRNDSSSTETVKRIRAILEVHKSRLGEATTKMLDALLAYWGTVSDLAQRQEHAASREGESLRWEDARRVVFHTLVVMYEIDKSVNWSAGEC